MPASQAERRRFESGQL